MSFKEEDPNRILIWPDLNLNFLSLAKMASIMQKIELDVGIIGLSKILKRRGWIWFLEFLTIFLFRLDPMCMCHNKCQHTYIIVRPLNFYSLTILIFYISSSITHLLPIIENLSLLFINFLKIHTLIFIRSITQMPWVYLFIDNHFLSQT